MILLIVHSLYAQNVTPAANGQSTFAIEDRQITLAEMVRLVLERNLEVRSEQYAAVSVDSLYQQYLRKYALNADLGAGVARNEYPEALASSTGSEQRTWDVSASVLKMFSTGTTLSAGVKNEYSKTTYVPISFDMMGSTIDIPSFGDPEYYRPTMFVQVQQEFLKNIFGHNDRRQLALLDSVSEQQRLVIEGKLAGIVLGAIVDYWSMVLNRSMLENADVQLRETVMVRNIIAQNVGLGLAEPFDLNYYNALVAGAEAGRAVAAQNHADAVRAVRRSLDLEDNTEVNGKVDMAATLPELNEETAIRDALAGRIDYKLAMKAVRDAELKVELYDNTALPELVGHLGVSTMGQQDAIDEAVADTYSAKYPSWQARVALRYAFGDTEQKANERDARVALQNARIVLQRTEREVRDDIRSKIGQIGTSHLAYVKAREARIESERYYGQLLINLRRGRFSATTVKQALDGLIDSRQRELQSLVQYNIALLQLDLATNTLFTRCGVDISRYTGGADE